MYGPVPVSYNQDLLFLMCVDPMQNVVQVLEKQYLEEKQTALEEQRVMYERELESLRQQLSPEKTAQHHRSSSERLTFPTHTPHGKLRLWTEERFVECTDTPSLSTAGRPASGLKS